MYPDPSETSITRTPEFSTVIAPASVQNRASRIRRFDSASASSSNIPGYCRSIGILVLTLFAVAAPTHAQETEVVATRLAEWLEEEGRVYAQSSLASGTLADVRIVLALMQASSELAPRRADPYRWRHELSSLLGDENWAQSALRAYTTFRPGDVNRRLLWIETTLASKQTAEERLKFLQNIDQIMTPGGPLVRSEIHRHLASILYGQGDSGAADGHVQESLREYPGNEAAKQLEEEFHQRIPPELAGTIQLLRQVGINPADWQMTLRLARELDCLGLREDAVPWYQHTRKLLDRAGADPAMLSELSLETARSAKSDGRFTDAETLCRDAIALTPESSASRMLLVEICHEQGDIEPCADSLEWLRQHNEALIGRFAERPDMIDAAALGWFFARVEEAYDKAVFYAERALEMAPNNPVAQSCAGYAYLGAGRLEEAIRLLTPIAAYDPMAAVALGRALCQDGHTDEGVSLIEQVVTDCASGQAYDDALGTLKTLDRAAPTPAGNAVLKSALARFENARRDYSFDPDRYLAILVEPVIPIKDPLQPWSFRFAMVNRSQFDITLGPGGMLNPMFVLSFELSGDAFAQFDDYMTVNIDTRPVLRPGQIVEFEQTVDTGPLRDFLWRTTQAGFDVRVRVLVDPIQADEGHWVPAPWAPSELEITFRRPGFMATASNVDLLITASESLDERARLSATRLLIALWAEHQANAGGARPYKYEQVPVDRIRDAVMTRVLDDEITNVRIYMLGALRIVHLGSEEISRLAVLLISPTPLIRLEAVLLFADQQGPALLPVVTAMAERDPVPIVRTVCAGLRDNWTSTEPTKP